MRLTWKGAGCDSFWMDVWGGVGWLGWVGGGDKDNGRLRGDGGGRVRTGGTLRAARRLRKSKDAASQTRRALDARRIQCDLGLKVMAVMRQFSRLTTTGTDNTI